MINSNKYHTHFGSSLRWQFPAHGKRLFILSARRLCLFPGREGQHSYWMSCYGTHQGVILPLASCQVAICYAYFTATYIDFTLSYGFLYSIHARFKTIYIDLMLFYSFFSSCYAYFTVTNVDFTLSCGFLSSIHACFKTIYIDVMLFYSFSSRCYACSRMIYLFTSYCFMASGQVSIILMVPVHVERPCQAAKAHVQKVSNVSKKTPTAK